MCETIMAAQKFIENSNAEAKSEDEDAEAENMDKDTGIENEENRDVGMYNEDGRSDVEGSTVYVDENGIGGVIVAQGTVAIFEDSGRLNKVSADGNEVSANVDGAESLTDVVLLDKLAQKL